MSDQTGGEEGGAPHTAPTEGGEGTATVGADDELDATHQDEASGGAAQLGKGRVD